MYIVEYYTTEKQEPLKKYGQLEFYNLKLTGFIGDIYNLLYKDILIRRLEARQIIIDIIKDKNIKYIKDNYLIFEHDSKQLKIKLEVNNKLKPGKIKLMGLKFKDDDTMKEMKEYMDIFDKKINGEK